LLCMDREDFTDEAKDAIHTIMASSSPNKGRVIALCGVADMRDEISTLRAMLVDESKLEPDLRYKASWRARLGLARMGSQTDMAQCIHVFQCEPLPVRRVTALLGHLAFTRQPEVIPVLREYLDNDETLPSEREGRPGPRYCLYAMDVLAKTIEGFPVNHDEGSYSQEQIDTAREWMKTHDRFVFKKRVVDLPLL
jgi:hypothetical protein